MARYYRPAGPVQDRRHAGRRDPQEHGLDEAGMAGVPSSLLKTSTQVLPFWVHCGVTALADSVPTVLTPPITVSVAAAVSSLLLTDMTVPSMECLGVDQDRIGADAIILRRPAGPADQG